MTAQRRRSLTDIDLSEAWIRTPNAHGILPALLHLTRSRSDTAPSRRQNKLTALYLKEERKELEAKRWRLSRLKRDLLEDYSRIQAKRLAICEERSSLSASLQSAQGKDPSQFMV